MVVLRWQKPSHHCWTHKMVILITLAMELTSSLTSPPPNDLMVVIGCFPDYHHHHRWRWWFGSDCVLCLEKKKKGIKLKGREILSHKIPSRKNLFSAPFSGACSGENFGDFRMAMSPSLSQAKFGHSKPSSLLLIIWLHP